MQPYMTQQEIDFFDLFFKPDMTVLEWGCGGSTLRWAPKVKKWYAIEHDLVWFTKVEPLIPKNCQIRLFELEEEMYVKYPGYYGLLSEIDVYIIDGRKRLQCRKFLADWMRPGSILFVHDAIRQNPSKDFSWHIDIIPGIKEGNHKGIRMYGKFKR